MSDFTAYYRQRDGALICIMPFGEYRPPSKAQEPNALLSLEDAESYLAEHPEALVPEPTPPEPTQEELKARRIQEIEARFDEIDFKTARPARLVALGRATEEDLTILNTLEDEAEALRIELRSL